jgi:hypothetical protein
LLNSGISFFGDGFSDTFVFWETDEGFVAFSEQKDVAGSSGENVSGGVFDVDDIKRTWVSFSGLDGTDSTDVLTADNLAHVTSVEFHPVGDFVGGKVEFDGVADFAFWVWVSDGSSVVCDEEWNVVLLDEDFLDSTEFVRSFFGGDSVDDESAFGVVDQSEVFVGLFDGDDIHETGWVFHVGSDFSVNFDHSSLHDFLALVTGEGVVKSVSDEDGQWEAFSEFVWSGVWSEAENTASFWQHPVVWSCKSFKMLLWSSSSHFCLFFCLTFWFL